MDGMFGIFPASAVREGQTKCSFCEQATPDASITRVGDDRLPLCPDCLDYHDRCPDSFWNAIYGTF